jgi:hypothetical protein
MSELVKFLTESDLASDLIGRFCFPGSGSTPIAAAVDPQGNFVIASTTESRAPFLY